jgi:hypothetical protein
MLAYREKNLLHAVHELWDKAKHPENLIFSIVSEQSREDLHPDLSFIPEDQLYYFKYDLSEFRGVMWSRWKTASVDVDYDYFFQTCGHNLFVQDWDAITIEEFEKSKIMAGHEKVILTVSGPMYNINDDGSFIIDDEPNQYHHYLNEDYVPGYGWPSKKFINKNRVEPAIYWQGSFIFTTKNYLSEVPFDPDMSYHGEEIYLTVQSWARGWRFWATPKKIYFHLTIKKYPDEEQPRHVTHRPWADKNKYSYWEQGYTAVKKLNLLLSGKLEGPYGDISKESVLEYCKVSGLDPKWTEYNPDYDKLDLPLYGITMKDSPIVHKD